MPAPGVLATLRLIAGWACVALGLLDLAMGLFPAGYVIFHVALVIAGVVLLLPERPGRRPRPPAWLAGGIVAVAGAVATAVPAMAVECCARDYAVRHGFPFTMLARDPGGWRLDGARTVADLIFWGCAGLVVLSLVARLVPARPAPAAPRGNPAHAEPRSAEEWAADDENVRGLP